VVGGEDIVLFKQSQHKAEAMEFMRFMLSKQTQVTMGNIGQMPVLSELAGSADLPAYFSVFQEQLKTAKARTPSPAWPKIDDAIGTAVTLALKGQATPQQALDQAAATIDGLLKGS
jgi:multiple sugar transport system substrate-binding protein